MSEYKIGEEVLVKANIVGEYADNCSVEVDRNTPILVRKDKVTPYPPKKTYREGLNEAWELAIKLIDMTGPEFDEIFQINSWDIHEIMKFSPLEVAEKIKAWETEKEIHVGDVVKVKKIDGGDLFKSKATGFDGVVSGVNEKKCYVILKDGSCGSADKEEIIKTGRTVDVDSFLAEIGRED